MTDAPVKPGDMLAGKYRVDRVLGIGGMGVVVQATHVQLEERVAIKFMLPQAAQNADIAGRFLREARLAVKLKSEHVAKVMDVGTLETGSPYIVM
jgi:eukaryotic-like serine/threonine-protein kinase